MYSHPHFEMHILNTASDKLSDEEFRHSLAQ